MTRSIMSPVSAHDLMTGRADRGGVCVMTQLERLYTEERQSPWLDTPRR